MEENIKLDILAISRIQNKNELNNGIKFKVIRRNKKDNKFKTIKTSYNAIENKNLYLISQKSSLLINFLFIFILCFSASQEKQSLRKMSNFQEIILNVHLDGKNDNFRLLNNDFQSVPVEVKVNDNIYNYSEEDDKKLINLPEGGDYVIHLYFNEVNENLAYMFKDTYGITKIDFSNFDTSNVKSMKQMFLNCKDLREIEFTGFDTSSVVDMEGMFQTCKEITSLDLSCFVTSNVETMRNMFTTCEGLTYLDVSNFNTLNVKDTVEMFCDCRSLENLDLSSFSLPKVNDMGGMFKYCLKLKSIKFSNTANIKSSGIGAMFQDCWKLTSLDLSCFDTSSITNLGYMFDRCYSLASLDLSSFDTSSVENFENIFSECTSLKSLDLSQFQTTSARNFKNMFLNCKNLEYLDLSKFITTSTTNFESMFSGCNSLIYLNLENFQKKKDENVYINNMFDGVPNSTIFCNKENLIDGENTDLFNDCENKCFSSSRKLIIDLKYCDESCNDVYKFEYNNICYNECPEGTTSSSDNYICKEIKDCKNYSNLDKTECFDERPDGYYIFDEEKKLLDKCHQDCKTCDKKEEELNTNCLECSNENYYFYYGNCYENCGKGISFTDNLGRKACTCLEKRKCKECSSESGDLCISCNVNKEYYSKCDEESAFIDCYERIEGYYLDEDNLCFKKIIVTDSPTIKETEKQEETQTTMPTIKENIETEKTEEAQTTMPTSNENKETEKGEEIKTTIPSTIIKSKDNWSAESFFLGLYIADEDNKLSKDEIVSKIRDEIINRNLDSLIENVIENNEDKFIKEENVLFQITTSENQNENSYTNVSTIKLGDCEDTLRGIYDIYDNETLIILKIDYNITGLLIPIIGYEIYHPRNKSKLNLSYCEESSINYNIPVTIDESNLDKYDQKSDYYTDECSTSEGGIDILLNDRKEEFINKNMSLCENLCEYIGYDSKNKKALCECGIRYTEFVISELENQTDLLSNNLVTDNTTTSSNIGALKCYNTLFTKEGLLTNIGSYILIIVFAFHLISIIVFYKCGYHLLDTTIQDIIDEKKMMLKSSKKKGKKEKKEKKVKKVKKEKPPKKSQKKGPISQSNSNIYMIKQKVEKTKKTSVFFLNPKKVKQRNSVSNPAKKDKIRKAKKKIGHENTVVGNNSKSINNLQLKDSSLNIKYDKNLRSSALIYSKKNLQNLGNKINNLNIKIESLNDFEINTMDYSTALTYDKRSLFQYYISFLKTKHPLLFTFCLMKDFNILVIKMCLLLLSFVIYYAFNTIFFDLSIIHKIYEEEGRYNLAYLFPIILYSFIISYHINILVKYFTLSERNILEVKKENSIIKANKIAEKVGRCLIIKHIIYFIVSILILIFFWYYLSSFCAVYKNSQVHLIKNTFISFALCLIYPFFINIIPAILRRISLNSKNRKWLYNINKVVQLL